MVIKADALHYKTDVLSNLAVLCSLILVHFTNIEIFDVIIGVIIAFYIIYSAFSIIKKGDTVYVNAGVDKGKTGRVLQVLVKEQRAIVEGVNMVSKSTKPNAKSPQGGILKQEAAIHISNLNPVENGKPVRVGRKLNAEGKLVRISKKSGGEI
jgi:large subunit ribosomal protein L24